MEVCKVCGAFLIVGDAPARLDDHMQGKQHVGYQRLRNAVDEIMVSLVYSYYRRYGKQFINSFYFITGGS